MKTLFISHDPHPAHLEFAKSINAKIKIIPFKKLVQLSKTYPLINYFYPTFISFLYSLRVNPKEEIVLVDGGSSLYLSAFLKMRMPSLKIVYLDGDLFMHLLYKKKIGSFFKKWTIKKIDAIISVSEMNKKAALNNLKVPVYVCPPYPKRVYPKKIKREDYGLYVGRLDPDKNALTAINFALQCPVIKKFIVIGSGSLNKKIIQIAKNNKIQFLGEKTDPSPYYNKCKFLIHLPEIDPHPCTIPEAVQCGCFPIVSQGVGANYLLDKEFIVKDPKNFPAINSKLKYILNNESKFRKLLKESSGKIISKQESVCLFKKNFNHVTSKWKKRK